MSRRLGAVPLILLLFSLTAAPSLRAAIPPSQRAALETLHHQNNGAHWPDPYQGTWMAPRGTECAWAGVRCNAAQTTVVGLDLSRANLSGALPAAIADLPDLESLYADVNRLTALPPAIGRLTKLQVLSVQFNPLGKLPPEVGDLTNLRRLAVTGTGLTELPPLGRLTRLWTLRLGHNHLTAIPAEVFGLTELRVLEAPYDQLAEIPTELARLTNLYHLDLSHNGIAGEIPAALGALPRLQYLILADNLLSGPVPPELSRCGALRQLSLERNRLSAISPELADAPELGYLNLSDNQIAEIPPELARAPKLVSLGLDRNRISRIPPELGASNLVGLGLQGNQIAEIPAALGEHAWQTIDLSHNRITSLPPEIGSFRVSTLNLADNQIAELPPPSADGGVVFLDLSHNLLTAIPAELVRWSGLYELNLAWNRIAGPMPDFLAGLPLRALDLSGNPFTAGPIPDWMRQFGGTLADLRLRATNRTGTIPGWLPELTNLRRLDLGANPLTPGPVPRLLGQPSLEELRLDGTNRTGPIPTWLLWSGTLNILSLADNPFDPGPLPKPRPDNYLWVLDLGNTRRTGALTLDFLQQVHYLRVLRLDRNALDGWLPDGLGVMTELRTLHLESNRLLGAVPPSIMTLGHLGELPSAEVPWMAHDDVGAGIDLRWNGLWSSSPAVTIFVNIRQVSGSGHFQVSQTVPPTGLKAMRLKPTPATKQPWILLTWKPVLPGSGPGFYQIYCAPAPGGTLAPCGQTADKTASSFVVKGLPAGTAYDFVVRTVTPPHAHNANQVESFPTPSVRAAP